jgi:hypothetical protein
MPVLMVGGRHDYTFPLESSQKPSRSAFIREVLGWLDRYLGPVNTQAGPPST